MPRLICAISLTCFLLFSCNRDSVRLIDISSNEEDVEYIDGLEYEKCSTENPDVYGAFVEDALEFLVFRFIVENYSNDSIRINSRNFDLSP